jgi:AAA15 family ATPase/GTPase
MIDKIRLRNFKGHLDTTVPLGRFTVLVGDNASGKTSVLEALSLLTMIGPAPHLALKNDRAPRDLIRRH